MIMVQTSVKLGDSLTGHSFPLFQKRAQNKLRCPQVLLALGLPHTLSFVFTAPSSTALASTLLCCPIHSRPNSSKQSEPATMSPPSAFSEPVAELRNLAQQYLVLFDPDSANVVVGQQLDARVRTATRQLEMQMQNLVKQLTAKDEQLKAKDELIKELKTDKVRAQEEVIAKEKKCKVEKSMTESEVAEKEMWAKKERAARKRKWDEVDNDDGDSDDEDEEDEQEQEDGGGEILIAIYEEMKALVKEYPKCMLTFLTTLSSNISKPSHRRDPQSCETRTLYGVIKA